MSIRFKKVTGFIIGISFSMTVLAQQNNLADRLKNASAKVNELVQANADYMSQNDQREVLEMLRLVRDKVKPDTGSQPGNPNQPPPYNPGQPNNPGQDIRETQTTGLVSRKSNGDWITIRLNRPVVLTQLSIRAVGSSKVRIYKILAVNLNSQTTNLNIGLDISGGSSPGFGLPNTGVVIQHLQILAEAWSNDMSLVVGTVGHQSGQSNGPGPSLMSLRGTIERSEFTFNVRDLSDLHNQCVAFVKTMGTGVQVRVDEISLSINYGTIKKIYNSSSHWLGANEVCLNIINEARLAGLASSTYGETVYIGSIEAIDFKFVAQSIPDLGQQCENFVRVNSLLRVDDIKVSVNFNETQKLYNSSSHWNGSLEICQQIINVQQ